MDDLPGLDLDALTRWLDLSAPDLRSGALTASLITGGRSNLTYRVTDGASVYALRRPPLSHVLPTAHDMRREFRVISALQATAVPVPRALGLCEDPEVNGPLFYVMEFVDGHIVRDAATAERALDEAARRNAGR